MSTIEPRPVPHAETPDAPADGVLVLEGREVPLGGPRAMTVRRTLPHRERSFVGAWCFVDHYGPDDVARTGGMLVPPHPHTGLATVSWLFEGEIEHRDSGGVHAMVRPGEVNLMTGGAGIAHSEVSTPGTSTLHGVQLWFVLPDAARFGPRDFQHHACSPVEVAAGVTVRVLMGDLAGVGSPVTTPTPLLGAEVVLAPGARWSVPVEVEHEHGLLVDTGEVTFCGQVLGRAALGVVDTGHETLTLEAGPEGARGMLLGGEPFDEEIVMWWNLLGRTHEEIAAWREEWNRYGEGLAGGEGTGQFGHVDGHEPADEWLPAPPLPSVRLRTRGNRRR